MSDNKGFLCNRPKVTGSSKIHTDSLEVLSYSNLIRRRSADAQNGLLIPATISQE